ncbi:recombinase family protein [Clostridium botulinum]|uniref:Recombinase family protein n=1 Tax=Clostridium botulinum TaxID=1491 RepID=A0A6G4HPS1_CLOBO|nr:recombinase family protein [Clostridium botulinum]MBO0571836.1 recombinase family protein [Clostridium botulinum]NFJ61647.1 recombinase family protein [Clostridium botulinum]NFQ62501.1 recombinase family protein [Clostridium botulinum]NFR17723.1 recombinase family protein [Clostridium botulinum]NFU16755.1 recombinase family protein [Clostridium botulinum]
MIYGYCRSGNLNNKSLENQIEWVKSKGVKEENIYKDTGSGIDLNRVELNKLLDNVKEGDIIFSKDISRITRNSKGLEEIIKLAKEKQVKFALGEHVIDGIRGVDKGVEGIAAIISSSVDSLRGYEENIIDGDIDNIEE